MGLAGAVLRVHAAAAATATATVDSNAAIIGDAMSLAAASTPDECATFLMGHLPEARRPAAAAARDQGLTGAALFQLTEEELGSKLGIVKFGTKRS